MDTPVQFVKGVGPRLGSIFSSRGIATVKELLTFFPRAYEDRSKLLRVSELQEGIKASVALTVVSSRKIPTRNYGRTLFEVRASDETGTTTLKWFNLPRGMDQKFTAGTQFIAIGTPKKFAGRMEIAHPEISWGKSVDTGAATADGEASPLDVGRVVPIYTEIEEVPSRALRKILHEAITKYAIKVPEDIPARFLSKHQLPSIAQAIREIHFPTGGNLDGEIEALVTFRTPSHARLIYDEFFKFEFLVLRQRLQDEKREATKIGLDGGQKAVEEFEKTLPFKLTGDQKTAVKEILSDLAQAHPMNRLVQGDVGSGKTAVAFLTAAAAIAEGHQVALMAPTEILAEQHLRNVTKLFGTKMPAAILTGKSTASERTKLIAKLEAGQPMLVIGTHALIEDPVKFKNLALTMIDEQHRFGVDQRRALRTKGMRETPGSGKPIHPHSLVLTATPIPRTLALTAYGDLAVSTIREMPPGRSPIVTQVIRGEGRTGAMQKVRDEIRAGRQAYFIYPLVNDSEAEGFTSLKSAITDADRLQHEVFPEFKVGLLHGQMRPEEKSAVMDRFKRGELQILVSTTVVEVGVDVPNASVLCVEHAERFGLSQLHQLRGRVGRGQHQSYCYFFTHAKAGETTETRLETLEKTNDGFEIAEADLELRGPGEFLGTRQAGTLPFRIADLVRDRDWLIKARQDASDLLKIDPELLLPEHVSLRSYFNREGRTQSDRLKTS